MVEKLSVMSGNGWEALPDVQVWWEALLDIREASRMSGRGREAILDVREWSGGSPGCPSGREALPESESGQETLLDDREALSDVREWSRGSLGCL